MKMRTYQVDHNANLGKIQQIKDILPLWRSALCGLQLIQIQKMKHGKKIGWLSKDDLRQFNYPLSQRQLNAVSCQVNNSLLSWQKLARKEFHKQLKITRHHLSPDELPTLRLVNKLMAWWNDSITIGKETIVISGKVRAVIDKTMDNVLQHCPFPNFHKTHTMLFNDTICSKETSKNSSFDSWLTISTLTKGKPVKIPLRPSGYFESRDGIEAGVTQVTVKDNGMVVLKRVKKSPKAPKKTEGKSIGLDWGLCNLLTTSKGDTLGTKIFKKLQKYDSQIQSLQKSLQRQNIPLKESKRYRRLVERVRGYLKNEIGRIVNRLIENNIDLKEIVVENLDFRCPSLGKTLNRIISHSGRKILRHKLDNLSEDTGINITEVNPAYTSQECSSCGYVDKNNRPSQGIFRCLFCNHSSHADHNAAKNILGRRSTDKDVQLKNRTEVLMILDKNFTSQWEISFTEYHQRQVRHHRLATRQLAKERTG